MINAEDSLMLGGKLALNMKERQVDTILKKIKKTEVYIYNHYQYLYFLPIFPRGFLLGLVVGNSSFSTKII